MAENEISDYLEVDSNNIDIAGISVQENVMRPPAVNNAFRALQGALKRYFRSDLFRLRDSSDQTKLLAFDLSAIPTATTRTYKFPALGGSLGIITPWVAYTPTITSFGTPTSVAFYSRRVGDTLEIAASFVSGTSTAVEARVTLGYDGTNGGITISGSTKTPTIAYAGGAAVNALGAQSFTVLAEQNVGYLTFGIQSASTAGSIKRNGNEILNSGTLMIFRAAVPITGW